MVNDRDTLPQMPTGPVQKLKKMIHGTLKADLEFGDGGGGNYLFSVTKSCERTGLNGDHFQFDSVFFSSSNYFPMQGN